MEFYKLSGAGNDFIILNNMDGAIDPAGYPRLAAALCRRRVSIGGDGLMAVEPSAAADFRMVFFNADGSAGEMCGNGARCICRYGYETGLAGRRQTVETPSGLVTGQRLDRRRYRVRLTEPTCIRLDCPVEADGVPYTCAYIELGTPGLPHAVVEMPGLADMDWERLRAVGRALRHHPAFPKGANVNFYAPTAPDEAVLRTFERGVEDFTCACGTGSAATALTMTLKRGKDCGAVRLRNPGGELTVEVRRAESGSFRLYLTGPTNMVAAGRVLDEDLEI